MIISASGSGTKPKYIMRSYFFFKKITGKRTFLKETKKKVNVFVMDLIVLHPTQQCGNMEMYKYVTKGIKFKAYLRPWKLIPLYLLKISSRCRALTAEI